MRFILFVEGYTENKSLPQFLKKWIDPRIEKPVGIKTVRFEGWPELLKDAPLKIKNAFPLNIQTPELVNFHEPPAKLLERLYPLHVKRSYKKIVNGKELFDKLDPNIAYQKCPKLKELLDKMLELAHHPIQKGAEFYGV